MNESSAWVRSPEHPGYRCKTVQHGACTILIRRPDLSEAEQKKREELVGIAIERTFKNHI